VLLARWLTPHDYGAFTVAYAVFWIFGMIHTALLTEPMLVLGSGKYKDRLSEYLEILLYGHWRLGVVASISLFLLSLGMALLGSDALSSAMLGLSGAAPLILFQWLTRRASYVSFKPYLAAVAGAIYMALMLSGLYALYQRGWLSVATAFCLMGVASLGAGAWLNARLGVGWSRSDTGLLRDVSKNHWNYGRWALPSNALRFTSENMYYFLLPVWGGLQASAAFKALMNPITPVLQAYVALSMFLLPVLVQVRGRPEFRRFIYLALALFTLGSVFYWGLLGYFHRSLAIWLYGGQYQEYINLLWLVGLVPILTGVAYTLATGLRALELPNRVFWAHLVSTVVTLTAGLWCLITWEVRGAIIGYLAAQVVTVAALAWLWKEGDNKSGSSL
jgi:O-antigen/teichoic acid export membrane protein